MKTSVRQFVLCASVVCTYVAAAAQSADANSAKKTATISGIVVKDPNGEPVKKVVVELIADEHERGANYTAVSGADGTFAIYGILPGQYRLFVEKTGYLEIVKNRPRPEGRLLALSAGQEMKDTVVHLQPGAVAHGRITDEDGDPLAGAQVSLLRQTYQSGHRHWEAAGAESTNDLGEYRIAGIAPGTYYVSVNPPPNFRTMIEASGPGSPPPAAERQRMSYRTTYYPAALEPDQATPVTFHAGDEFPMDFSLTPQPSFMLRGVVVGIPPNASAVVMLQSGDLGEVFNGAEAHKDGTFEMPDVAPGEYSLIASATGSSERLMSKQRVHIGSAAVEGLRLNLQPGSVVRGHLALDAAPGTTGSLNQFSVLLVSDDGDGDGPRAVILGGGFSSVASVQADGSFEWKDVAPGHYTPQLISGSFGGTDWFLRAANSGGRDLSESGFTVSGSPLTMELAASSRSASVTGLARNHDGKPVANATIVAVPSQRYRKRSDCYVTATSDQTGHFTVRGVRPGDYTLFSWETLDGEQYFDPDFLKRSEGRGIPLKLAESERKSLELEVIPAEEQP